MRTEGIQDIYHSLIVSKHGHTTPEKIEALNLLLSYFATVRYAVPKVGTTLR